MAAEGNTISQHPSKSVAAKLFKDTVLECDKDPIGGVTQVRGFTRCRSFPSRNTSILSYYPEGGAPHISLAFDLPSPTATLLTKTPFLGTVLAAQAGLKERGLCLRGVPPFGVLWVGGILLRGCQPPSLGHGQLLLLLSLCMVTTGVEGKAERLTGGSKSGSRWHNLDLRPLRKVLRNNHPTQC